MKMIHILWTKKRTSKTLRNIQSFEQLSRKA